MTELKMFSGEVDFVIAETADEAYQICLKFYSFSDEDYSENDFKELPMDKMFTFNNENEGIQVKTVREFIEEYGKGFFASSEY